MKIEIVDFYLKKKTGPKIMGTMHIYLIDYKMDIRGIHVYGSEKKYFYFLPSKSAIDPETKNKIWYPLISFSDQKLVNDLKDFLIKNGGKFINKRLEEIEKEGKRQNFSCKDNS